MSLGQYAWSQNEKGIFAHTYLGGTANFDVADGVDIDCLSSYPWEGKVKYTVNPKQDGASFFFAIHIPGWCKNWTVLINGEKADASLKNGYLYLDRVWKCGDRVDVDLDMPAQRMYANTRVRADAGCVALQRGPIVYCFEEIDNGSYLSALRLPRNAEIKTRTTDEDGIGKVVILETEGIRTVLENELYSDEPPKTVPATLKAVPYYTWGNRKPGAMRVWILE